MLSQGLQGSLLPLPPLPDKLTPKATPANSGDVTLQGPDASKTLQYPVVLQGALDNIQKYQQCVLLTRVGGFYELYFNHAEDLHQELGLKRSYKDTKLGPVAMAGFPFFQLDRYLKILVSELGRHVAISEEFRRESGPQGSGPVDLDNKNIFDRRVSRIVTPGTLIDEKFMETGESNYLLSLYTSENDTVGSVGLAWMDLSTGEFYVQETGLSSLASEVQRIKPKEIITSSKSLPLPPEFLVSDVGHILQASDDWNTLLTETTESFSYLERLAGSTLIEYVSNNLPGSDISLLPPSKRKDSEIMTLDSSALHSLEIRQSMRDQSIKGSLLHAMRRTVTKSGTRLLSDWLVSPVTSIPVLEQRLDLVALMIEEETLKAKISRFLKTSGDAVRVLQRFTFGRGEVDDLLTIIKAIKATDELRLSLASHERAQCLTSRIENLSELRKKISGSIDEVGLTNRHREDAESAAAMMEEVLNAIHDPAKPVERRRKAIEREISFTMKPAASTTLRQMHKNLANMQAEKVELESKLRETTRKTSLTLKTLPGLSHIVHVKGSDAKSEMPSDIGAKSIGSTRTTRSYHIAEWSYLGTRIEQEMMNIHREETRTFHNLRREVLRHSASLRANARVLDELDVATCFANLATENNWVRPVLNDSQYTEIVDGKHPIVEFSLRARGLPFTPNSTTFDAQTTMYLVTGTNMGGKSTYLRQTAVIQILAQIGSYVPARKASIGIADALFSRLGSSDNLFRNESTFMCEMKETASILSHATKRSLVLMDEVGRGTTSIDGTAIAYACLRALNERGCRTLFSTHFHEMADLLKDWQRIDMLYTDIIEDGDGSFNFSHKIQKGVCRDSHGLKIAMLAGLPPSVLDEASVIQARLLLVASDRSE